MWPGHGACHLTPATRKHHHASRMSDDREQQSRKVGSVTSRISIIRAFVAGLCG